MDDFFSCRINFQEFQFGYEFLQILLRAFIFFKVLFMYLHLNYL